jgi:hypothetical protein
VSCKQPRSIVSSNLKNYSVITVCVLDYFCELQNIMRVVNRYDLTLKQEEARNRPDNGYRRDPDQP